MNRWIRNFTIYAFLFTSFVFPSLARADYENWQQFRRDERHSGYSPETAQAPYLLKKSIQVDGNAPGLNDPRFQGDLAVSYGRYVLVFGGRAGGLAAQAHAPVRALQIVDRLTLKPLSITPKYFDSNHGGIETSSGNWPFLSSEKRSHFMESGWNSCSSALCSRMSFDIYGNTTGKDDGSDIWRVSNTEWHLPSVMWSTIDGFMLWGWMKGVPGSGPNDRPLGYMLRSDAVWSNDLLITNQIVSVKKEYMWNRKDEPQPKGTCGLTVWDTVGKKLLAESCGTYGLLSTDGNVLWTTEQDWRTDCEKQSGLPYDQFKHNCPIEVNGKWVVPDYDFERPLTQVARSKKLVAFKLPSLEPLIEVAGYDVPPMIQEPAIVLPDSVVWLTEKEGVRQIASFDSSTGFLKWSAPVDPWRKIPHCSYYSGENITQTAASGNTLAYVGKGISFYDLRSGKLIQKIQTQNSDGSSGLYFNPIFINGQLWVMRGYGNRLSLDMANGGAPPEGWVQRKIEGNLTFMKFDGFPPPALRGPQTHTDVSCGAFAVEVYDPSQGPVSEPDTYLPVEVSGRVAYRKSNLPVPEVQVSVRDAQTKKVISIVVTDAQGVFSFPAVNPDRELELTLLKIDSSRRGVSALDAAKILQAVAGTFALDDFQKLLSDVTGNGSMSALDSSRILQLIAGSVSNFEVSRACGSDWIFDLPVGTIQPFGPDAWISPKISGTCQLGVLKLGQPNSDLKGMVFEAGVFGDVTLNWTAAP